MVFLKDEDKGFFVGAWHLSGVETGVMETKGRYVISTMKTNGSIWIA